MKPLGNHLSDRFLDEELGDALCCLPPHERRLLRRYALTDWADERGHERTVSVSVRIPISVALRLDIERGALKRRLGQRRLSRSDVIRLLLGDALAEQAEPEAVIVPAQPALVPEKDAA